MNIDDITGVTAIDQPSPENLRETLSEVGASLRIYAMHGSDLLYCPELPGSGWVTFKDGLWRIDDDGSVMRLIQSLSDVYEAEATVLDYQARDMIARTDPPAAILDVQERAKAIRAMGRRMGSMATVQAVERALRTRPGLRVAPDSFDVDPWLIATRDGTLIDMRTMTARPAERADRMMRTVGVSYDPTATCPQWEKFMGEICNGDELMIRFLQRALGYSLIGVTIEQCFFLCAGNGANGKSTMLSVARHVFGAHSMVCPSESFVGRREGQIPNDLARLAGARFVIATEMRENAVLEEHTVKQLTGEDAVTVRFLNREFFEYIPRFTLWLATNHKPRVRGTDNGIWRRVKTVPFRASFTAAQMDKGLPERLKAEGSGILNWFLEGARMWTEQGLGDCPDVSLATAEYRQDQDVLAEFIDQCCVKSPGISTTAAALFSRFSKWCIENGEFRRSQRWLGVNLRKVDWVTSVKLTDGSRAYKGIRIADGPLPVQQHWPIERAES